MGKISRALDKKNGNIPTQDETPSVSIENTEQISNVVQDNNSISDVAVEQVETLSSYQTAESWDERLVASTEYHSSIAENFRKIRTLILHPSTGKPGQSILVISSTAQEGKTFVSANLGVSLAHGIDRKALIMDCDLRRPSLHNFFGASNTQGLVDYLVHDVDLEMLIQGTQMPGLTILPSGPPPENPSELVSSQKTRDLIAEAINRYDDRLVVLDSPPLQAASETIILSQLVDKIILVVRWGKEGREEIKRIVDQVGRDKILGVIFNAFEMNIIDRKVQGVGYHNYYSESYY